MTKLYTKGLTENVDAAETVLEQAMHITNVMQKYGKMTYNEFGPRGRLYVRITLLLTCNENDGREGIKYTMARVQKAYLDEMSTLAKIEVKYDKWSLGDVAASLMGLPWAKTSWCYLLGIDKELHLDVL